MLYFLRLFFNFLFTPYENGTNWVIIISYVFWNEEYKPTGFLVDKDHERGTDVCSTQISELI